ncbi:hypothetical protein ACUYPW_003253 [Vibrio vulnificus]
MGFKKVSNTASQSLSNVMVATDVDTVKARNELDYSKLFLLPKDCWSLRQLVLNSRARNTKVR